jgi:hypothetical protein
MATHSIVGNPPRPVDDTLPPIDEDPLEGPPPTTWHDFRHAKLRRFPHEAKISWLEYLDHVLQGIVFKATASNLCPVAIEIVLGTIITSLLL